MRRRRAIAVYPTCIPGVSRPYPRRGYWPKMADDSVNFGPAAPPPCNDNGPIDARPLRSPRPRVKSTP